jgi:hypothetical protein
VCVCVCACVCVCVCVCVGVTMKKLALSHTRPDLERFKQSRFHESINHGIG